MNDINWLDIVNALASLATAIGIIFAWWEIRMTQKQTVTDFEDDFGREYREIIHQIPARAMLGEPLNDEEFEKAFQSFYQYIDLTNEQTYLRQMGRVSAETWRSWCEGIEANLRQPAFNHAWEKIKANAGECFYELRQLEKSRFKDDPRSWKQLA